MSQSTATLFHRTSPEIGSVFRISFDVESLSEVPRIQLAYVEMARYLDESENCSVFGSTPRPLFIVRDDQEVPAVVRSGHNTGLARLMCLSSKFFVRAQYSGEFEDCVTIRNVSIHTEAYRCPEKKVEFKRNSVLI